MSSRLTTEASKCQNCDGTGKLHGVNPCRACGGTGIVVLQSVDSSAAVDISPEAVELTAMTFGAFYGTGTYAVASAQLRALRSALTARDGAMETIMRVTDYMPEGHHKESIRNTINAVRT